jgi:hypothetical protein
MVSCSVHACKASFVSAPGREFRPGECEEYLSSHSVSHPSSKLRGVALKQNHRILPYLLPATSGNRSARQKVRPFVRPAPRTSPRVWLCFLCYCT